MASFYVDRAGIELRADGRTLLVYEDQERASTIPLNLLERVVISARTRFDSTLISSLARAGVALVVLGRDHLGHAACLLGPPRGDAARRISQYRAFLSEQWRSRWSSRLLRAKLLAQARTLQYLMRCRPDQRKPLQDGLHPLLRLSRELKNTPGSVASLLGIEGAAASVYFQALSAAFPASLGFAGRNRRPPRDPVNAVLSLTYTLTHCDAVRIIYAAGLDPYIGFYHGLAWNRESLACDLIEPLRPRLDRWVWELFRDRILRPEHFRRMHGACLLGKAGRRLYYQAHEAAAVRVRRRLQRACHMIVRLLAREFPISTEEVVDENPVH